MAYDGILLTEEQRKELTSIPPNISEWEIVKYYTFSDFDIEVINKHRRNYNRLGFAMQLAVLRYPGWSINHISFIPRATINYIAEQLTIDSSEYAKYANRKNTIFEHLQEIREVYGYKNFTDNDYARFYNIILPYAMENENPIHLINIINSEIRKEKIILPGITTIERLINQARIESEELIIKEINSHITTSQKILLDNLLDTDQDKSTTTLSWLRSSIGYPSSKMFHDVVKRIKMIRRINIEMNTDKIHPNRIRQFSRLGTKYEPFLLRRFENDKRYAILVVYLYDLCQSLTDKAIEIYERQINTLLSKGRKDQEKLQRKNGKALNEKLIHFAGIGSALIKSKEDGIDPFEAIENVMPWEKIVQSVEEARELVRPANYDYIDLLDKRYNQLRKFTPALLTNFRFNSNNSYSKYLIDGLNTIHEMNESNKRKIPDDAPIEYMPNRWNKYVFEKDGSINKHYYEIATFTELRNRIRAGDISVEGSRNHKSFDEYLISKQEWNNSKKFEFNLPVSLSVNEYLEERTNTLMKKIRWISKNIGKLESINIKDGRIHLSKLDKSVPSESIDLGKTLYKMLPKIKLPELLIEVSNWTNFHKYFIHASTGKPIKTHEEKANLFAALMAMGTNIGLSKMAEATPSTSYRQLANMAQWRLNEDTFKKAQSLLVNYQHRLFMASYWGDGSTSSSDGMRVQVGVSSLHAEANPHYGSGKGATIYRFVSDQFSTFYTKVINTNARDAVHVIDGLLYHETDLDIEEHYTDTAGYTDQIFGLSHLLGFRFAPRIRDITDLKLYIIGRVSDFPKLENILKGKINTKIIRENYDDVLRLTHSIKQGKVSASLIMNKLGSYSRQNAIATALREMGRIEKTIFILDYISNEALRRRIQKGLNKGEAMNGLARAIFFGKRGELRERDLQAQLQRASALNILINAISVWNTTYLHEAVKYLTTKDNINEDLLKHVTPLRWEHINFLGEYRFNTKSDMDNDSLRPLNYMI